MKKLLFAVLGLLGTINTYCQKVVYVSDSSKIKIAIPDNGGDGRAVVICPGGGYNHIAGAKEGDNWIPYFTSQGIAVAVVRYTLPYGDRNKPLNDVREAFRLLYDHSKEWNVNPKGFGIMGFSAGGHLAAAYANSEASALRPRFEILLYPVIRLDTRKHYGMARKFLGESTTMEERKAWSANEMVTDSTAATFIALADDDKTIEPTNSTCYYDALKRKGIPCTLHIYPRGGHGIGFKPFAYHGRLIDELTDWLKTVTIEKLDKKIVVR